MTQITFSDVEQLCKNFKADPTLIDEYNSIIFNKFKLTDLLKGVRENSKRNSEYVERFLFNVFEGMTYEHTSNIEKIAALIVATFVVHTGADGFIYITKEKTKELESFIKTFIDISEPLVKDGNEKLKPHVEYIVKNLVCTSKTGRNTTSYTDKETALRVIRDSIYMYPMYSEEVVSQHLKFIHNANLFEYVPMSMSNVIGDLNVFIEKLQKDLIMNGWSTQWSKRKTFFTNYVQHCKDKINNNWLYLET